MSFTVFLSKVYWLVLFVSVLIAEIIYLEQC